MRWLEADEEVTALGLPSHGSHALVGCQDGSLRLLDLEEPALRDPQADAHEDAVRAICFDPRGTPYTAGADGRVVRWSADLQRREVLLAADEAAPALAIAPGRLAIALASKVIVRSTDSARTLLELEAARTPSAIALSADGRWLAVGDDRGGIVVADVDAGRPPHTIDAHDASVRAVAFLSTGDLLSVSKDRSLARWEAATGASRWVATDVHTVVANALAVSPDERRAYTGGSRERLRRWDLERGVAEPQPQPGHHGRVLALMLCDGPRGRRLVSASGHDRTVRAWDLAADGPPVERVLAAGPLHYRPTWVLPPTGRRALHVGWQVTSADLTTGAVAAVPDSREVYGATIDDSGRHALLSLPGQLLEWDLETEQVSRRAAVAFKKQRVVTYLHGDKALVGADDGELRVGGRQARREVDLLRGQPGLQGALGLADGREVLTWGSDGVERWDLLRARVVQRYRLASAEAALAVACRGQLLVVAEGPRVVLFDLTSGALLDTIDLRAVGDVATALAFDEERLWVGTGLGQILELRVR